MLKSPPARIDIKFLEQYPEFVEFRTTGSFSSEAIAYVEHIEPKVVLIDGRRLAELMMKRVDSDYFEEG